MTNTAPEKAAMGKRAKKSEQTRERIYRSSIKLMKEFGYENAHIRDICKEAGVSVRTFYLYFTSKNDVIYNVYNDISRRFTEFSSAPLSGETSVARVRDFVARYARLNADTDSEQLELVLAPNHEWHGGKWKDQNDYITRVLAEEIKAGQKDGEYTSSMSAEELAFNLLIALRGILYLWCCTARGFDLEKESMKYFDFLLPAYKVNAD